LIPYIRNPRKHSETQISQIAASIREFGFMNPVLIDGDYNVIAGHGRLLAAQKLGLKEVPCLRHDHLTETQKRAYILADNRLAERAEWDYELLQIELEELANADFDLDITGFDPGEIETLLDISDCHEEIEDDEVPELPEEPTTKQGDLWVLGKHRILCGDSTNSGNIERLMDGVKADLVLTDPPYGVDYIGKTKNALKIQNDATDEKALETLIKGAFDIAQEISRAGAYWYATVPAGPLHLIFASDWKRRGILRQILVWVKDSMVLGHSEYHYRHEPILFGWIPGDRHKNSDRTRTSVWEYPRPKRSEKHPTMKPVALWANAIADGSNPGEVVYDPFLGSGTTVIAAEKLDRICYGVEIDPKYCDVVIERWENLTNQKARKVVK